MAVRESFHMQGPNFYRNGILDSFQGGRWAENDNVAELISCI